MFFCVIKRVFAVVGARIYTYLVVSWCSNSCFVFVFVPFWCHIPNGLLSTICVHMEFQVEIVNTIAWGMIIAIQLLFYSFLLEHLI